MAHQCISALVQNRRHDHACDRLPGPLAIGLFVPHRPGHILGHARTRWTSPPVPGQANVYAGLFHDDAAFEAMPASLTQRLDEEQRSVLRGISSSTKAVHVVDALAGTGKSQLARCLINRWGSLRDNGQGFLLMTLRTRSLRTEFLESLLSDKVVVLNNIVILLLSRRSLLAHRFGALASRRLVRRS